MKKPVVYDVNVLVNAAPAKGGDPLKWPALPPRTGNGPADAIGAINSRQEFALWLSPHILRNTRRVLIEIRGADPEETDRYLDVLEELAVSSGGGIVDPPRTVHDNRDHEDNLILDLAAEVDADLIVSADKDLVDMQVWRGRPLIRPDDFAKRVDAAWRNRPRTSHASTSDLIRRRIEKDAAERLHDHHVDAAMVAGTPSAYERLRDEFDQNAARLDEIVGTWNADNPTMKPRIEQWRKNLTVAASRASEIDQVAVISPEIAQDALTALNARLDFALERMDPARAPQVSTSTHRRARTTPYIASDEGRRLDDRQYGS